MKYYEQLIEKGCFSRTDAEVLTGNEDAADSLLFSYKKKGYIDCVRRNLFVAISLETKQPVVNRYVIASNIATDAYITHHSAFEYYGYANQVYYEVYTAAKTRFRGFEYDGITYRRVAPNINSGVDTKRDGTRVTDIERTVIDSINDFEKIGGLEELLHCLSLVPSLNEEKLFNYLDEYDKRLLYQRTGYILEHFKDELKLSEGFFTTCKSTIPKSKQYFYKGLQHESHHLAKGWRLFVPENLLAIINKGGAFVE